MSYIFGGGRGGVDTPVFTSLLLLSFSPSLPYYSLVSLLTVVSLCFLLFHEAREIAGLRPIDIEVEFWAIRRGEMTIGAVSIPLKYPLYTSPIQFAWIIFNGLLALLTVE